MRLGQFFRRRRLGVLFRRIEYAPARTVAATHGRRVGIVPSIPVIFARGFIKSMRIGCGVTTSLGFPAASRADTFRYTFAGNPAGTRHEYFPVFGNRRGGRPATAVAWTTPS